MQPNNDPPAPETATPPPSNAPLISDRRLNRFVLGLLGFVLMVWVFDFFSLLLQQILIAAFLVYLMLPIYHWLLEHGIRSVYAYGAIVGLLVLMGLSLGVAIRVSLEDLSVNLPTYRKNFTKVLDQVPVVGKKILENTFQGEDDSFESKGQSPEGNGRTEDPAVPQPSSQTPDVPTASPQVNTRTGRLEFDPNLLPLRALLNNLLDLSSQLFVVLVYLVFILLERTSFPNRIRSAFNPERTTQVMETIRQINSSISEYIYVKTFISFLTGLLSGIVLALFNVEFALLWGVLTFLVNFIPYLGAIAAVIFPSLLALVQFQSFPYALAVLTVLTVIQTFLGYWTEPRMTSQRVNLSPLVVILSLAFWGFLWGIVGMILAIPLTVVIKAVLENIEDGKFIAKLLSNEEPSFLQVPTVAEKPSGSIA